MTPALHAGLQLRPYQEEALAAIGAAEARGVRRQMLVAATGLGKTVIFTELARRRGGRALILAHRDELIGQAAGKVAEVWPDADVGIVKADRDEWQRQVVVASVQTLGRARRLERITSALAGEGLLRPLEPFGLVIVDEAHHAAADTYRRILGALDAGAADGPLLLGVTATPQRGDGRGLDDLFQEVVFTRDMLWGIRGGYLSDLRGLRLKLDVDLGKLKVSHGDYDQGQAGALMESAGGPGAIAREWLKHAAGRRTLVFTPTVAMAEHTAAAFMAAGVPAGYVSGETPLEERRQVLEDFSLGRLDVVANCAVLTEGYDEPRVDCIIVARPTRSQALYVQMVGRGTRRHPDKTDCLVLDVAGASEVHSLVTLPSLFGLDVKARKRMERDGIGAAAVLAEQMEAELLAGRIRAEEADLFRVVRADGMAWVRAHRSGDPVKRYVLAGKSGQRLLLEQVGPDAYDAKLMDADYNLKRVLIQGVSLEMAQGVGEDYVRTRATPDSRRLTDTTAPWRRHRPTPKQLELARKWHVTVERSWNAGQLSDAIQARIEQARLRKAAKAAAERDAILTN